MLHSWKSFTAKKANQILGHAGRTFWQSESYDHLIRDDDDYTRFVAYTINNPVSAGLCAHAEDWQWSSAYRATGVGQASSLPVPRASCPRIEGKWN